MIIHPSLAEFRTLARRGNVIPVYATLPADLETPLGALLKLARPQEPAFLFESVEGESHIARYSFVGTQPAALLTGGRNRLQIRWLTRTPGVSRNQTIATRDYLGTLRAWMRQFRYVAAPALPRFCGGLVGYLGYEIIAQWEPVPVAARDTLRVPDLQLMLATSMAIFDHARHQLILVANAIVPPKASAASVARAYRAAVKTLRAMERKLATPVRVPRVHASRRAARTTSNMTRGQFEAMVRKAKTYIRAGDIIQVVLSQRFARRTRVAPLHVYRSLRALNPSPYMFYVQGQGLALVGSSPEMLVRLEDRTMETRPIAGTRRRGHNDVEDARLAHELLRNRKERAEHLMLVDLGRNDLGRVAVPASVTTPEFCVVERYSHVMHLVSRVTGTIAPNKDAVDLLRSAFPAGTVSGAPKVRAMQIIAELEHLKRGPYAGSVGYLSFSGNLDTCITIRTILMQRGCAYVQAGAGIVADSTPSAEYRETVNKAAGMLQAIELAERGEQAR